jgi:hypothetical protein
MNMCLFMPINGPFRAYINESCSCPPVSHDLGPSPTRCIILGHAVLGESHLEGGGGAMGETENYKS